ncbi:transcription-repair coupling factor [Seongchinamella sediminis]|uniref:Transcription-repair-coupling factor n=1 Tax=Seongchinamella sediminis TaxID=2283635 RepID=A0A3L7E0S9_9GAMM|nr:transcription-repair coupling factor [Seongchinamella sediminis]RLQ23104.1 transcription-repair coupling factor [Seongchinamella sediminis]
MFTSLVQATPWPNQAGSRTALGPFYGGADARCIAELADPSRLLVVITADTSAALALERELPFYLDRELEILAFPDWETLPYDNFSPHQDIISERLSTLYRLPRLQGGVLIVPVSTLMHRLPPTHYVAGSSLLLEQGQSIDLASFRRNLERNGYRNVETVFEHGEFALRGSLFDIFPMGSALPYRIDLLDDEVDTLRTFDPETQRTVEKVSAINMLPAREYPLDSSAITRFQMNWWDTFDVDHDSCPTYAEVSAGRSPGGCEYYLPLFFDDCATLFDYLPEQAAVIATGDHHHAAEHFWQEVGSRFEEYGIDPRRPLLPPERGFLPVAEFYRQLKQFPVLELRHNPQAPVHQQTSVLPPPDLASDQTVTSAAANLARFIDAHQGPVLLCAESAGRREILLQSLREQGLKPPAVAGWHQFLDSGEPFAIATAPLDRGLYFGPGKPTLVCETQLFGNRVAQRRRRRASAEAASANVFRDINELREGVPVVHLEHGVGRYVGLQTLAVDGQEAEFLTLEYARGSKLYVPVASLHLISRYAGSDPDLAPLHTLGSEQWDKARRKASEKANDIAAQLLEVYARREARQGFSFQLDQEAYARFSAAFPFEETPDQELAIRTVVDDMCSPRVMDRLVCGDVGFGKTEVAMRAAFIACQNNKQVAVLVPTTLLAQQHYSSFCDRFADWPVNVEVVSRFKSAAEMKAVSRRIAAGKVDILVGTHKLLQSDFRFADLGLLIIDEEHRFGVKQKEAIKALRSEVDILTLTATPIPRTLNMALGGMRDLSIIATPPARRLSIKTFVREHNIALIKEAVLRETLRGGQVYYLHNEVKSIEESARKLRELVPELKVGVAHGQMRETELEQVMSAFYHQRHHILLCTTIIETGIDIPNANTIIIERADKFGLAQLHQLRGRVGRSHHQAYAYLLTPPRSAITADAGKRLEAIEAAGDLGAGYLLATHDLEIRGAGELLGDEQSGQIHSVGFSLYMDMLERAVAALKRGEIPDVDAPLDAGTEVNLHIPALIPEDYLPDINSRLVLYKRIAAAADDEQLRELQVEMIDRFGLLPEQVGNLFEVSRLRLQAQSLGIRSIEAGASGGSIEFKESTRVNPLSLVKLVQGDPRSYKLAGATRLRFERDLDDKVNRLRYVEDLLNTFATDATEDAA